MQEIRFFSHVISVCLHATANPSKRKTQTGFKLKWWPKLCKIRPDELKEAVTAKLSESVTKIVDITNETDLERMFSAERRRRSIYVRAARSEKAKAKKLISETKRTKRLARKRAADKVKREAVVKSCRGLPRSLVPTNIPEKHGAAEECYKVFISCCFYLGVLGGGGGGGCR